MEKTKENDEIRFLLYLLFLFLLAIFLLPAFMSLFLKYIPYSFQPPLFGSEKLFDQQVLLQEFTSPVNNLSAIGVSIRNFNLQSKGDIVLEVYSNQEVLRKVTVAGSRIKDGDIVIFAFDRIPGSLSKDYMFRLSTLGASEEKAYEVYTTNEKQDFAGNLYANDILLEKSLSFLLYFSPETKFDLVLDIYGSWFRRFRQDMPFFYFFLFVFFLLNFLIFYFKGRK